MIYEFDDAIWHLDVSEGNKRLAWLKDPVKLQDHSIATHVIAGNEYLADYARPLNPSVEVIPTVVDTNATYQCLPRRARMEDRDRMDRFAH